MAVIKINEGTQTPLQADVVGTINYPTFKLDVGASGASALFTNTLGTLQNLNQGTVSVVKNAGTIQGGTLSVLAAGTVSVLAAGTVDTVGLTHADKFGTVINVGTSAMGTIKAAVAGSTIYVTDLIISVGTPSNVVVGNGGTNLPIAGTFFFNTNGGVVSNFRTPIFTSSGSALVYKQSVDGPLTITAQGYVD